MDYSDVFSAGELRLVAGVMWVMVWALVAGYLALIYASFNIGPLFWADIAGIFPTAYVICGLIESVPCWPRGSARGQAARDGTGAAGPG